MSSITSRTQEPSSNVYLHEPSETATRPKSLQPFFKKPLPEHRRPRITSTVQVNPRPLPSIEEVRAARKPGMYYGFYAGEWAIQKVLIKSFPDILGGQDPFDVALFNAGIKYLRDFTGRRDLGIHIAWVAQRNKDMVPSIGVEVGDPTFIVGLFPLEEEAYRNRMTQQMVDLLAEMFETKLTWWAIEELTDL